MATAIQSERINFSSIKKIIEYPDFLDIQVKSFQNFFQLETPAESRENEGLFKVFSDNFPISDSRDIFLLEFVDYLVDPPKYSVDECIDRGLTYSVPLKAKLRLSCNDDENEDFETIEQEVFLGNIPYMTNKGSFVINGAERVIVSQLQRSPGLFYTHDNGKSHASGKLLYSARIIPVRGSWIDLEFDIKDVLHVRIDRRRKFPATILLKALGYTTEQLLEHFYDLDTVKFTKDGKITRS